MAPADWILSAGHACWVKNKKIELLFPQYSPFLFISASKTLTFSCSGYRYGEAELIKLHNCGLN